MKTKKRAHTPGIHVEIEVHQSYSGYVGLMADRVEDGVSTAGLFARLTPKQARTLAARLVAVADGIPT